MTKAVYSLRTVYLIRYRVRCTICIQTFHITYGSVKVAPHCGFVEQHYWSTCAHCSSGRALYDQKGRPVCVDCRLFVQLLRSLHGYENSDTI